METQNFPIRHFREMSILCEALTGLPAQLCDHTYSYESFGSWSTIVRFRGVRLRIVFDGRDHEYLLLRSASRTPPDAWEEVAWRKPAAPDGELPVSDIITAVLESAG